MEINNYYFVFQPTQQCIANCSTNHPTLDEIISSYIGWIQLRKVSIFRDLSLLSRHYVDVVTKEISEGLAVGIVSSAILVENGQFQNPCFGSTYVSIFACRETKSKVQVQQHF